VAAVAEHVAGPDGVLPGHGGGDGGLFTGILARYLADAALRRPELAPTAAGLVMASAAAAWDSSVKARCGPLFGPDWRVPAVLPDASSTAPEHDLSVQVSGWMVLEAAAALERRRATS
jgi:predicted alpha-1,6-mannanase (GH76 family)